MLFKSEGTSRKFDLIQFCVNVFGDAAQKVPEPHEGWFDLVLCKFNRKCHLKVAEPHESWFDLVFVWIQFKILLSDGGDPMKD